MAWYGASKMTCNGIARGKQTNARVSINQMPPKGNKIKFKSMAPREYAMLNKILWQRLADLHAHQGQVIISPESWQLRRWPLAVQAPIPITKTPLKNRSLAPDNLLQRGLPIVNY